ncbi:fimbrial protein [Enterobacillus tribolii]|nr:fimbrial protein [Enterobacillus tribolii]MBW7984745.1 fimbrial protein [Enterobacillus tribolii]
MTLLVIGAASYASSAAAQCYRVSYTSLPASTANNYVEPGKGTFGTWGGAADSAGGSGGLPLVININSLAFQPSGTVIASGSSSFYELGDVTFTPEQVLFRCTADEAAKGLYEYYATNGDSTYAGMHDDGATEGIPETYRTRYQGMGIRITNTNTGEYFSRYWKARELTNLDKDSQGWILVKAKNFSGVRTELIRLNNSSGLTSSGQYDWSQPAAYIAFKGGTRSTNLEVGADSATKYNGWHDYWPGAISLHKRITIRRSATCLVSNVTPNVTFPIISVAELNQNVTRQAPIQIQFFCQTGAPANSGLTAFVSGTAASQTAMGILVNTENAISAFAEGFGTPNGGVNYLLSDGYDTDPNIATGVGIRISDKNSKALTLLTALGGYGTGETAGWYPVLDATEQGSTLNGITFYTKNLTATLMKLPGKTVTTGKIKATAQVVIQVQ